MRLSIATLAFLLLLLGAALRAEAQAAPSPFPIETGSFSPAPAASVTELRVVSYNAHRGDDIPGLVAAIQGDPGLAAAHVLLIQEIENHPSEGTSRASRLARQLQMDYAYAPARTLAGGGTHGLAILSRFPLHDLDVIPLPVMKLAYRTRQRIALAATVTPSAAWRVRLYDVHLDTRLNTKDRKKQLQPVMDAALKTSVPATIIGGDFNTNPMFWAFRAFPIFYSGQAKAIDKHMKTLGFQAPFQKKGHTNAARLRLDALYTRGLTPMKADILRHITASDHYPLLLEVK